MIIHYHGFKSDVDREFNGYFNNITYNIDKCDMFDSNSFDANNYINQTKTDTIYKANSTFNLLQTRCEELKRDYEPIKRKIEKRVLLKKTEGKHNEKYIELYKQKEKNRIERMNIINVLQKLLNMMGDIKIQLGICNVMIKKIRDSDNNTVLLCDKIKEFRKKVHMDINGLSVNEIYEVKEILLMHMNNTTGNINSNDSDNSSSHKSESDNNYIEIQI